METDHSELE